MSAGTVGVGIIGAGLISDIHVRGLQRLPGVTVIGIADLDPRRAADAAARHGISGSFGSSDELLRRVVPEVVHVLTPPASHADVCEQALNAGVHVYVEKPMASSVEDCERIIAAARRNDRHVCAGHCMVYDPIMQQLLAEIDKGRVGEVLHASAVYTFDARRIPGYNSKMWYRQLPGGFVEDLAAHPLSLLLRVVGAPLRITRAAPREASAEDSVSALIDGDRAAGSLFVSLGARPEEVSLEVRGTRGTLRANFSGMTLVLQRDGLLPKKIALAARNVVTAGKLTGQTVSATARHLLGRGDGTKGIHSLIAAFYRALASGGDMPVSAAEGKQVVAALRTLWPSAPLAPLTTLSRHGVRPTPNTVTALVTGASGFIGTHLVRALCARGVSVRALIRDPRRADSLASHGVDVVLGDFGDPGVMDGLTDDVDVVFHLASVMRGAHDDFERVDLAGTRRLLEAARRSGVKRVVFTSTMGAFALGGLRDGAVVRESMSDDPARVGPYSRAKLLIEEMLRDAQRAGAFEAVIARPGLVFGPGLSPYLTHLPHLGTLIGDRYVVFGDGEVPLQLTYVENTVDALWRCASVPDAAGETFTIIDDDVPTQREYVARLAQITGRSLRVVSIPRAIVGSLGLGVETLARAMRRPPPTTRRLLLGKTRKLQFDTSAAKRVLGWTPQISWSDGLAQTVAWEKNRRVHPDAAVRSAQQPEAREPASELV